eukprot:6247620-Amphidinium_carterae.1
MTQEELQRSVVLDFGGPGCSARSPVLIIEEPSHESVCTNAGMVSKRPSRKTESRTCAALTQLHHWLMPSCRLR